MNLLERFGVTIPQLRKLREELPEVMDLLLYCLETLNKKGVKT